MYNLYEFAAGNKLFILFFIACCMCKIYFIMSCIVSFVFISVECYGVFVH